MDITAKSFEKSFEICLDSVDLNETNADKVFDDLEKVLTINKEADDINEIITTFLDSQIVQKCFEMKSSIKKTIVLQEKCVRVLTLCIEFNSTFAKRIAIEHNYFNEFKNWLQRFLLMKQTDIRELSIRLLMSFFKHVKVTTTSTSTTTTKPTIDDNDREYTLIIKKIFLTNNNDEENRSVLQNTKSLKPSKGGAQGSSLQGTSSLLHCFFSSIGTDTINSIDLILRELLFKFIQNDIFSKSDKVKLFNERIISYLIKIFEWRLTNSNIAMMTEKDQNFSAQDKVTHSK
jgi:hypothetical protein